MSAVEKVFGPPPLGIDLADDRLPRNNAVVIAMFILSIVTVILRFVARLRIQKAMVEADDWTITAALIPVIALFVSTITGGYYGLGKHVWATTMADVVGMEKILFIYGLIYLFCLPVIKVSIILFYRRVFGMNWQMWVCLFLSVGWGIGCIIAFLVACQPLSYFWTQYTDPQSGKCVYNLYGFYIGNAAVNVFTDFLILLVPIPIVWRLQMRNAQKILVCGIFFLGGFVCVASIIRIYFMTFLARSPDITWIMGDVYLWSEIEVCVAIVCACLPTLQPLLRVTLTTLIGSSHARGFGSSSRRFRHHGHSRSKDGNGPFQQLSAEERRAASRGARLRTDDDDDEAELTAGGARVEMDSLRRGESDLEEHDPGNVPIQVKGDVQVKEQRVG